MKFLCVGDNCIDYYLNTNETFPGGNALNVSAVLARNGADSYYLGNIAKDVLGDVVVRSIEKTGIRTDNCGFIEGASTKYCTYNVYDGERSFVSVELGKNWQGPFEITDALQQYINTFDWVCCSVNAKIPEEIKKISATNAVFAFDFGEKEKYRTEEYLSMVTPGIDMAQFSYDGKEEDALEFCEKMHAHGIQHILLTLGSKGQIFYNGEKLYRGYITPVKAVDTMGAGDAYLAGFSKCAIESGWKKGQVLSEKQILDAMAAGSKSSAENCLVEGGFGYKEYVKLN